MLTDLFIGWSRSFDQIAWAQLGIYDLPYVIIFFLLLFIVIGLTVTVMSAKGGLIHAVYRIYGKKKVKFLTSFREGLDKFWEIFIVNLVYRLLYLIILGLLIYPALKLIMLSNPGSQLLLTMLVYFIIIPIAIILDLVARYSIMFVVIHNNKIPEALSNAWLLFRTNWISSIEMALLILSTLFAAFLLITIVGLPILMYLLGVFGSIVSISEATFLFSLMVALLLMILLIAFLITVFTTFQVALWVGFFRGLTSGEHRSKVHRLANHAPWLHNRVF